MSASYPANSSFSYTVPAGKIMKITDISSQNTSTANPVFINGQQWSTAPNLPEFFSEGTQIEIQFNYNGDFINLQYILFDN